MTIPTFSELVNNVKSDLRNKLGVNSIIGKVFINAFSVVQGSKLKLFYLRSAQTYLNIFLDQCDDETIVRYGRVYLDRDPLPATAGEYKLSVTGEIGAVIAAGTTFKSRDTSLNPGQIFITDDIFTFTTTTGIIDVRSLELGIVSKLNIDDELKSTQPLADIDDIVIVQSVTTTPIESETIDEYRAKVKLAAQVEPQGGARVDLVLWASDAQGERNFLPYVKSGEPSVVQGYVEANPADSVPVNTGIPTQTIIDNVEAVINLDPDDTKAMEDRGRRPMWLVMEYLPVVPLDVDIEITSLSDTSLLSSIKEAVRSFIFNIRPYLDGADNPNDSQKGKLYPADIIGIIRDTIGSATFSDVEISVDGNVITTYYEFLGGNIPYINNVTAV